MTTLTSTPPPGPSNGPSSPPSAIGLVWALIRLGAARLRRGRSLMYAMVIAALPVMLLALLAQTKRTPMLIKDTYALMMTSLVIMPALLVAAPLAEEVEERTLAYLWSRPLPRWGLWLGKIGAGAPFVIGLTVVALTAAYAVSYQTIPTLAVLAGAATTAFALCLVSASLATVWPKHGMTLAIIYGLFFDTTLSQLPLAARGASLVYWGTSLSGYGIEPVTAALWGMVKILSIWTALALWRLRYLSE